MPRSTRKPLNLVCANTTCSGSITFLSLTLVTKSTGIYWELVKMKKGVLPFPQPWSLPEKKSTYLYSVLKSASSLVLKLMSAVMQIALVLSDSMKSLSVIRMLSEYSFEISNFVSKFLPWVGSAPSWSRSRPLVSLTSLSFFINKFSVWVSLTSTPRTKILSTTRRWYVAQVIRWYFQRPVSGCLTDQRVL